MEVPQAAPAAAPDPASGSTAQNGRGPAPEPRAAIVVFARLPVPGRVKTRLAAGAGVGPIRAAEFYRACAQHAIAQAASCAPWADVFVFHSSADVTAGVASWLAAEGLELPCRPQIGPGGSAAAAVAAAGASAVASAGGSAPEPDLGAKMLAAMTEAQRSSDGLGRSGRGGKVLIMGTDIPDMTGQLLRRAADALDEHEMVIGPSLDGGYYLLGLTRLEPRLFQDMVWSTDSVLEDTLARAAAAGVRVAPLTWLPRLRDVDTVQDLAEWVESRKAGSADSGIAPLPESAMQLDHGLTLREDAPEQQRSGGYSQGSEEGATEGSVAYGKAVGFCSPQTSGRAESAGLVPTLAPLEEALAWRQRYLLFVSRRVLEGAAAAVAATSEVVNSEGEAVCS